MDICHVYILRLVVLMGYLQFVSCKETTCYYGWANYSGHCYYFSDSMLQRDEAIEDCTARGDSSLVTVANQDVNNFIHDNRSSSEPYWIGLRRFNDSSWGWNNGRIDEMIAWHGDQPSNSSSCGVLWSESEARAFITQSCNIPYKYVCESDIELNDIWSSYNGHWYTVITDIATQPEAANHCIALGGYLARLTTSDEIEFVSSLTSGHLWVGLTSLVWDDGTAYNWNNWVDHVAPPYSPCAALDRETDRWRLNDCHHENYFICSTAPQLQIYTYNGTAEGAPCVFPFIYEDTVYFECTIIGHVKLWCSTTHNYDTDIEWGNCLTTTDTVPTSSVSISTTPLQTSSSTPTSTTTKTTQSPVQDQTTIADTVAYSNKFSSESQTTLVRSTYMDESSISDGISDLIATQTTQEPQDLAEASDVESHQLKGLHIVLGIVYGLVGVMAVIDAILAFKYWKLVHTKASDETSI